MTHYEPVTDGDPSDTDAIRITETEEVTRERQTSVADLEDAYASRIEQIEQQIDEANAIVDEIKAIDTVGYNHVSSIGTPGCRISSRSYSRQYEEHIDELSVDGVPAK